MTPRLWPTWYKPFGPTDRVTMGAIRSAVARRFGLHPLDLASRRRTYNIAHPRQLAMLVAARMTSHSYAGIGRLLGGLDHTTVIFGVEAAQKRIVTDPEWAGHYACIKVMLG